MGRLLDEDDVIDAFAKLLAERCGGNRIWWKPVAEAVVKNLPPAQPEIIRCKDCKKFEYHRCTRANHYVSEYDHCMSIFGAERRTDADMRGEQDEIDRC